MLIIILTNTPVVAYQKQDDLAKVRILEVVKTHLRHYQRFRIYHSATEYQNWVNSITSLQEADSLTKAKVFLNHTMILIPGNIMAR